MAKALNEAKLNTQLDSAERAMARGRALFHRQDFGAIGEKSNFFQLFVPSWKRSPALE